MLSKLFKPIKVGPMTLKNRFIRSATYMAACDRDGIPSQECLKYYRDLADGDMGLIIPGFLHPVTAGRASPLQGGMTNERQAQSWKSTIEYCQKKGSKFVFQIGDAGLNTQFSTIFERPRGATGDGVNTRTMTQGDIDELIEGYARAAKLCESVSADGIQVHSCHMYLLAQFLSPSENKRTDKYGGSPENRCRLHREILEAIKSVVSKDFSVSMKLNGDDCKEGGTTPNDAAKTVSILKKNLDFVEVSCGRTPDAMSRSKLFKGSPFPPKPAYNLEAAKIIKKMNKDLLVAPVGGFRKVTDMEAALQYVDLISLSRPTLAETDVVKRLASGQKKTKCVSCGQCMMHPNDGMIRCWI